ncbi:MAG: hypothetical protein D8M59_04340 [Planctomycetes bacterium]|nr:hypothetical protein [Planctomycetota bacterium]NOG55737.1 hypothetical protein [Planctomycetota bacterium]
MTTGNISRSPTSLRTLSRVLIALYVLFGVIGYGVVLIRGTDSGLLLFFVCSVMALAVFVVCAGWKQPCLEINQWRLIVPCAIAGTVTACLAEGLVLAVTELLHLNDWDDWLLLGFFLLNCLFWSMFLYFIVMGRFRYTVVKRLALSLLLMCLVELSVTIPCHLIVTQHGGWFVGIYTVFGVMTGIYMLCWSIGPLLLLLYLLPEYKSQCINVMCPKCGYDLHGTEHVRCPECGYRLRAEIGNE